jgi:hypothetical protein
MQGLRQTPLLYSAVMHPRRATLVLLLALAVGGSGCVSENRPADCEEPERTIDLTVTATTLEPNDPAACREQAVTLLVSSEVDGIIHIHGLDAVVPATTITSGEELVLEFTAERSGQFPIELHPADDPEGVSIGIFTIHEP